MLTISWAALADRRRMESYTSILRTVAASWLIPCQSWSAGGIQLANPELFGSILFFLPFIQQNPDNLLPVSS
jgi:hypothetical protein